MTVLRCTAKLLKRLKQPAKPPEPEPQANPLGEWYADIDFWRRKPFVVMLNGATGAVMILNGKADMLRRLDERAGAQFASLCEYFDVRGPRVDAELHGFDVGFAFGRTRDRSLLASLNQRKSEAWHSFEHGGLSLADAACEGWANGLFQHPSLGRDARFNSPWHNPLDLLRDRLKA
ncbi:MAG TPA: hypothetical protein VFL78_06570 [Rhodanobacteraceae bacterium]|nr:hypothetical protein [Rhodanobacteraceae bacterium]